MSIDETDREILKGLMENGRIAYRELAERTGVTPPTVKSRVDSMIEDGVIEGFTIQVNEEALTDGPIIDALIEFETEPPAIDDVYEALTRCEGATTVMKTSDSRVVARFKGSRNTFEEHVLDKMPEGVTGYRTVLIIEEERKDVLL